MTEAMFIANEVMKIKRALPRGEVSEERSPSDYRIGKTENKLERRKI